MSYHIATIDGNLTADPITKKFGDREAVEISIAINYTVKGEKKASFFRVIFFDPRETEYLLKNAKKGSRITVTAEVRTTEKDKITYTNYNGTRILQLYTPSPDATAETPTPVSTPAPVAPKAQPAPAKQPPAPAKPVAKPPVTTNVDIIDDDLPF